MQNTMLDTVVSSNSQELSSVEYVDSHENSIATIPRDDTSVQDVEDPRSLELIFGQKHNEIDCALCPTAKRACNRAWVTAKQIENWSKMSTMTLSRRLHELEDCERITSLSDLVKTYIPDSLGVLHETTLYNLNVLNQLAMVEMKNKVLNETAKKFSDILSEVETTGSYCIAQLEMSDAEIMSRALEIAHRTLALREERIKALTAENAELKDAVGRGSNWRTVAMMKAEWKREFGHAPVWQKLKKFSADLPKDMQPIKDVEVKVVLKNGSEKVDLLTRYHREAWAKYREYEENSRAKKNVPDTKILDLSATYTEVEYF